MRLLDGRVLVAGGSDGQADLTSAELYDPATGTWSATGSMIHPHDVGFAATLLGDGRVLASDVTDGDTDHPSYGAELYDPNSGTWTSTGSLDTGGVGHSATLLANGKVLVDGGPPHLYDPDSGTWTPTGQMEPLSQFSYTAALLSDGRVLVVGGEFPNVRAHLYDPATGSWTAAADMPERLTGHDGEVITATLLSDGTVLVTGPGKADLYDPAKGIWTATREQPERHTYFSRTATLLLDGSVLLVEPDGVQLYDPTTGSWTKTESLLYGSSAVTSSAATLLLDGTVLVVGDSIGGGATDSAELYVPARVAPPPAVVALPTRQLRRSPLRRRPRHRSRACTHRRPVPSRPARGPGRSPSSTRAQSPRHCSWPRMTRAPTPLRTSPESCAGPSPPTSCRPASPRR